MFTYCSFSLAGRKGVLSVRGARKQIVPAAGNASEAGPGGSEEIQIYEKSSV